MTHGISHGPSVTECARCCGSSSYALTSAYRVFYRSFTLQAFYYLSYSCDLDPMTFIYELDPYSLEIPDIRK